MDKRRRGWLALAVVAVVCAGCGSSSSSGGAGTGSSHQTLVGPLWQIVEYVNAHKQLVAPAAGSHPSIQFHADGTVNVATGCNTASSRYTVKSDVITYTAPFAQTMMACSDELHQQESDIMAAVPTSTTFRSEGAHATLGQNGNVGLRLQSQASVSAVS